MKKKILNIKKLPSEIVGDGKRPNKYFVTIGYGWYRNITNDYVQAKDTLESVTIFLNNKRDAINMFRSINIDPHITTVIGETIGQVIVEDRLMGVLIEKTLVETPTGFYVDIF